MKKIFLILVLIIFFSTNIGSLSLAKAGSVAGSSSGSLSGVQAKSSESLQQSQIKISIGKSNGLDGTTGKSVIVMQAPGGGVLLGSFGPSDLQSLSIKIVLNEDINKKGYVSIKRTEPLPIIELGSIKSSWSGDQKVIVIGPSNGLVNDTKGKIIVTQEGSGGGKLLSVLDPNATTNISIRKSNGLFGTENKIIVNQDASGGGVLLAVYPEENLAKELVESMSGLPYFSDKTSNNNGNVNNSLNRNVKEVVPSTKSIKINTRSSSADEQ